MPQVEVTFDVDANGILNVTAKEKTTGKSQSITIQGSSGLSKDDIQKMQKDAEMHADEDKKKHEVVEAKNIAEQLMYTSEKAVKDAGEKIPADIKTNVESKVAALKQVKDGQDLGAIKTATEALSTEIQKIGQYMSQNAAASAKATDGQAADEKKDGPEGGDGNVRDAEFKEEKK
jgi:molecular chaperone DnaK